MRTLRKTLAAAGVMFFTFAGYALAAQVEVLWLGHSAFRRGRAGHTSGCDIPRSNGQYTTSAYATV
jgi:hypothetical protein